MEFNKKNIKIILLIITFAVAVHWLFNNLQFLPANLKNIYGLLSPFITGLGLAYIINLPTRFFERLLFGRKWKANDHIRLKLKRPVSLLISILLIIGIIIGLFFMVLPTLIKTIQTLTYTIPDSIDRAQLWLNGIQEQSPQISRVVNSLGFNLSSIGENLVTWLTTLAAGLLNSTVTFSVGLLGFLFNFIISVICALYIIGQKEQLGTRSVRVLYAVLPERWADNIRALFELANQCFSNFLSGQVLEAVIFGSIITSVLAIFKFPYATLIGVLSGCMALIPVLGAWVGAIIGALLQLTISPMTALYFLIAYLVTQQIEGNLIYPRVVGKRVGLPPILVLFAVVIGGSLWGIVGAFISIPIMSMIYELLGSYVGLRLDQKHLAAEKTTIVDENQAGVHRPPSILRWFKKNGAAKKYTFHFHLPRIGDSRSRQPQQPDGPADSRPEADADAAAEASDGDQKAPANAAGASDPEPGDSDS